VTVPVAADGDTIAVAVTGWPTAAEEGERMRVVVEVAWMTVKGSDGSL
jgi:hypothetical protein